MKRTVISINIIFSILCIFPLNVGTIVLRGSGSSNKALNEDIIHRTRKMTDSIISTLRLLAKDPIASKYFNRIINNRNNVCLGSLEEAIEGIENTTALVENAGDDIKALIDQVKELDKLKGPAETVRKVANLLRMLGPLIHKITPDTFCQASPDQAFRSIEDIKVTLLELAKLPGLRYNVRKRLRKAATTVGAVKTFFFYVRLTFERFDKMCSGEKQYNIEAINALGDLLSHLADLLRASGGYAQAQRIRKGKLFSLKLTKQLRKFDLEDLGTLDCSRPGDFSLAADTMDDIATFMEDIGQENLQLHLGVDFNEFFI